jgi:two-component system chemotaxis response regulator CheY
MKILIIDDSCIVRRVISKAARELGLRTIEAENGADGLAKLRKQCSDICLIVLDWNMPVMDGYEFLTRIRSEEDYNHIPVIMATSDGVKEDVLKALKAGVDSYLVKPFTEECLCNRIREILAAKKPARK